MVTVWRGQEVSKSTQSRWLENGIMPSVGMLTAMPLIYCCKYRALFTVSKGWDRAIWPPLQWAILPSLCLDSKQGDTTDRHSLLRLWKLCRQTRRYPPVSFFCYCIRSFFYLQTLQCIAIIFSSASQVSIGESTFELHAFCDKYFTPRRWLCRVSSPLSPSLELSPMRSRQYLFL
jgi:hypothetical protein